MSQQATLGMWLERLEQEHGGTRKAAAHFGIDAGYWWRLKAGEKTAPSEEVLQKLGLRVTAVLYGARPPGE